MRFHWAYPPVIKDGVLKNHLFSSMIFPFKPSTYKGFPIAMFDSQVLPMAPMVLFPMTSIMNLRISTE